jgi:SAM-dependent methyltransferase
MRAYQGNLCDPQDENPETFKSADFFGFDLAVVGLGFHHFDDPNLAARRLAARLKPGGVLVILDFLPHAKPDVSSPFLLSIRIAHPPRAYGFCYSLPSLEFDQGPEGGGSWAGINQTPKRKLSG